jgi:hypothetical protein
MLACGAGVEYISISYFPLSKKDFSKALGLITEAASTSEISVSFHQIHGATSQKTVIFILATVKT